VRRLVAVTLLLWGCSEPGTASRHEVVVRDSVGIAVVDAPDLSAVDTLAWRVDVGNALTIGVTDGEDPYLFSAIAGVARLSDGRIVVADRGTDEVRFFDSTGAFLHAVGGRGDGPGEYRSIAILRRVASDSIVVVDRDGGRVTVLDPGGRQVRRFFMAISDGNELPTPVWGVFSDGTQLTLSTVGMEMIAPGVLQHRSGFRRMHEGTRTVTSYQGAVQTLRMVNERLAGPGAREGGPPPSSWAVGEDLFLYAPSTFELEWWIYAGEGQLERILRIADPSPWSTSSETAVAGKLTADTSGRVWIELNTMHGGEVQPVWLVWPAERGPMYALRLPPVATYTALASTPVMEIGEDYVLIASLNEDGAPVVRLMPLHRH
jgi:hypothetical protein